MNFFDIAVHDHFNPELSCFSCNVNLSRVLSFEMAACFQFPGFVLLNL